MRLINFNFTQQSETGFTCSSENPNYPVENIRHEFRNKTWRSSGYFLVDGTNNKIDFKESALGSELTAVVTPGEYTPTSLATEIKTQLEITGSDTFSVSYSQVTGLWTISSDGTYLSLLINSGTNSANCILKNSLGFSNTDKTGYLSYTGAKIAIHTEEYIVFDLKTTEPIDSIVLLWPKNELKLSNSAAIKVQANATNTWSSPAVNETLTLDDTYETASKFFTTDQSYRYWRVVISDSENANLHIDLGIVFLGQSLNIVEPDNGFQYQVEDQSKVIKNSFGNEFVDEYPDKASLSLKYGLLDYEEAQALENAYRQNGKRKPVLAVIDETDSTFSNHHFLIYGKFTKPSTISQLHYKYFGADLVIEEIL